MKRMYKAFSVIAVMILVFSQLPAADTFKPGSRVLRFHESVSGLQVDSEDLKRILMNSRDVSRLKAGNYELGLSMLNTPIFLIAGMEVTGNLENPERTVSWNKALDMIDGRYLSLPSLPPFEWSRNRMHSTMPFRLLFYSQSANLQVIKLEIRGTLQRDLSIPGP